MTSWDGFLNVWYWPDSVIRLRSLAPGQLDQLRRIAAIGGTLLWDRKGQTRAIPCEVLRAAIQQHDDIQALKLRRPQAVVFKEAAVIKWEQGV